MKRDYRQQFFRTARNRAELRKGRTDWYEITARADTGSAVVRIYDEIGWFGVTAEDLAAEIGELHVDEIEVRLDSPGGSAFDGITIYNELRAHRARIRTTVYGMAASAASVIFMAGDERMVRDGSMVMIHDAAGLAIGQAGDMREMADLLDKLSANVAGLYASRTGRGSAETWRAMMAPTDTWFDAGEAVEAGLATGIDDNDNDNDNDGEGDAGMSWDLSIYTHPGRQDAPAPDLAALVASIDPTPDPTPATGPDPVPPVTEPEPVAISFDKSAFLAAIKQ